MKISEIEKKDFVIREAKWQIIEKISAAVASSVKSWLSIIILASKKKPSNKMWGQTLWYFHLGKVSKKKKVWNFPYFSGVGGFEKVIFHKK